MKSSSSRVPQPHTGWPPPGPREQLTLGPSLTPSSFSLGDVGARGRPFPGQQGPLEFYNFPTPAAHLGLFKGG